MNKKELKRLRRRDLLELLIDLSKENEDLRAENKELEARLNDRTIAIAEAGSLAEAALRLNDVFRAAQDACDQYIRNIQQRFPQPEEEAQTDCIQEAADTQVQEQVEHYEQEDSE